MLDTLDPADGARELLPTRSGRPGRQIGALTSSSVDGPVLVGDELIEPCATCGASTVGIVTETVDRHRVAWAVSIRCGGCGAATEVDDWGEMPEIVRAALVARVGLVRLRVDAGTARELRVPLLAVFRKRGMTFSEAAATHTAITSRGVVGTPAKMQLLADQLAHAGVIASVTPAGDSD